MEVDSTKVYDILLHNAPEDFQDPNVPSVVIVGKKGKFIFGVGGYVKAVAGWDFRHPIESTDEFITSKIPMGPTDGDGSRFSISAKQTHLFLNFVALPGTGNEIGAFVSANLLDNYKPTLQFAYLQYDISNRFSASATYSQFRTYAHRYKEGSNPWDEQYKYGQYVSTNIFYEASSFFEIGFEYIWGRRMNYDGMKCADNRVQLAFQLSF